MRPSRGTPGAEPVGVAGADLVAAHGGWPVGVALAAACGAGPVDLAGETLARGDLTIPGRFLLLIRSLQRRPPGLLTCALPGEPRYQPPTRLGNHAIMHDCLHDCMPTM